MAETNDMEFDLLRRRAANVGLYLDRHLNFDPCLPGGDLYIASRRRFRGEHVDTLLKYATVDQCHDFLTAYEEECYGQKLRA
jgi:hypothetical protein